MALPQTPPQQSPARLLLSVGCGFALLLFIACLVFMRQEMMRLSKEPETPTPLPKSTTSPPVPIAPKEAR